MGRWCTWQNGGDDPVSPGTRVHRVAAWG
jgi:hypothetical protein